MTWTQESVSEELKRIQASVPKALMRAVVSEYEMTPTMIMVVEKALESPDFPEAKKVELRKMKEKGIFTKKKIKENSDIAKKIDNYIGRQINKSIKEGRLPPRGKLKELGLNPWQK